MLTDLLIWCGLFAVLIVALGRGPNGVLSLSYFISLSIQHIPGILAYMGETPFLPYAEPTKAGLDLTLIGMASFVGAVVAVRFLSRRARRPVPNPSPAALDTFHRLSKRFLVLGVGSYFLVMPAIAFIPSATSLTSSFALLLLAAVWLQLFVASREGSATKLMTTLALLPLLPLSTLVSGGFLGFGTIWLATVLVFLFSVAQKRFWFYLAAAPAIYLGLSLFVTYMHHRDDLRRVMWSDSGLIARLDTSTELVTDFELLDLSDWEHDRALAGRLNQNYLVGLMAQRHEAGYFHFYRGATVPLWALIPRALWPGKPPVGGSGTLVEDTSGLHFAEGTSVGVGQVAEFYINFGRNGVIAGFTIWGLLLMWFDSRIRRSLARFDADLFVAAALPGLALVQPLGSLLEVLVSFIAANLAAAMIRYLGLLSHGTARRSAVAPPNRRPVT